MGDTATARTHFEAGAALERRIGAVDYAAFTDALAARLT
jgi:hypothetical protein